MLAPWASEEMKTVDLPDKRLNERLAIVLSQLAGQPTASIPAACGGYAETAAAYRLFENERLSFEDVLQPHIDATRRRVAEQPAVILAQDTTELDFSRPQQQVVGAGPMDGSKRRGAFLHPLCAFTPDGVPLGTVAARVWTRSDEPPLPAAERQTRRKKLPIEQKESQRWIDMLRRGQEFACEVPGTRFICVADSEADIYEMFAEPRVCDNAGRIEWLIRACQDRGVVVGEAASEVTQMREAASAAPALFAQEITVRGRTPKTACEDRARRQPRSTRKAIVTVRAKSVTLLPPKRAGQALSPVTVNVVLVREDAPPEGEVPVEWVLVTTLPIGDVEAVRKVVAYYTVRWMIELLFRTLKSGCRLEKRRFEDLDRLLPCAAVYLIIAWRTLMVCRMGRSCPDINCEAIFEPEEWKAVYVTLRRQPPPSQPPRLEDMIRLIAQLGGYVNRPARKDPPGVQTLWLGMQRMQDLAWAWCTFGPGAPNGFV